MKTNLTINSLRTLSLLIALVAAIGSLYFMLNVGHNNKSIILIGMFAGWVLSPFAGMFFSNKISNRWANPERVLIYWLIIAISIASVVAYSGVFIPPETKPAFIFLIFPLISWMLIISTILIARKKLGK